MDVVVGQAGDQRPATRFDHFVSAVSDSANLGDSTPGSSDIDAPPVELDIAEQQCAQASAHTGARFSAKLRGPSILSGEALSATNAGYCF